MVDDKELLVEIAENVKVRVVRGAINGAEIISVGVLNLVRQTLVGALSGLAEIGGSVGAAGVTVG